MAACLCSPLATTSGSMPLSARLPLLPAPAAAAARRQVRERLAAPRRAGKAARPKPCVAARDYFSVFEQDFAESMRALDGQLQRMRDDAYSSQRAALERAREAQTRALQGGGDERVRSSQSRTADGYSYSMEKERYQSSPYTSYDYTSDSLRVGRHSYARSYTHFSYSVYGSSAAPIAAQPISAAAVAANGGSPGAVGVTLAVLAAVYATVAVRFLQGFRFTKFFRAERLKLALIWPWLAVFSANFRGEMLRALSGGRLGARDKGKSTDDETRRDAGKAP